MSDTQKATSEFVSPEDRAVAGAAQAAEPPPVPDKYRRDDGSVNQDAILVRLAQLEKRLGEGSAPKPAPEGADGGGSGALTSEDLAPYVHEYAATQRLSDGSYKKLEQRGLSRDIVDTLIQSQQDRTNRYYDAIAEAAGGREEFNKMAQWASENLTAEEQASYSGLIHGFDQPSALAAVRDLMHKMNAAKAGPLGHLVHGDPSGGAGVVPFRSQAEVSAAMRVPDPNRPGKLRYDEDPAYRLEVDQRNFAFRRLQARGT